jgi:hypothetical protein
MTIGLQGFGRRTNDSVAHNLFQNRPSILSTIPNNTPGMALPKESP